MFIFKNRIEPKFFIMKILNVPGLGLLIPFFFMMINISQPDISGGHLSVQAPAESGKGHTLQLDRQTVLDSMQAVMGPLPERSSMKPADLQIRDSLVTDKYTRYLVTLKITDNEETTCYLYIPVGAEEKKNVADKDKIAAMLVLHGTGNLGKRLVDGESPKENRAHAKELAERGYVVIAPDYPSMGEQLDYNFDTDRYQSGTMKAIVNHMRCVDLLQSLDFVDPERIGVIGHSLGGHNSIFVAAFDPRLKVVVTSCGWTKMAYYNGGATADRIKPWAQKRYMPLIGDKYSTNGDDFPFDFDEVIATLAPRAFFSNSPINDHNFDVEGVKAGIPLISEAYKSVNALDELQVRYPDAEHDFPPAVRSEAYEFIDRVLKHSR